MSGWNILLNIFLFYHASYSFETTADETPIDV
jgi:hypothetical protein